jgi:hypothetical protein
MPQLLPVVSAFLNREPRSGHKVDPLESQSRPKVAEFRSLDGATGHEWLDAIGLHVEYMAAVQRHFCRFDPRTHFAVFVDDADRDFGMVSRQFIPQKSRSLLIESEGFGPLDAERSRFLWNELARSHAHVSIRLVDEHGEIRSWLEPTEVPFDRRHVFNMKTRRVQPLVTSGTVKRVGLYHLWTRL